MNIYIYAIRSLDEPPNLVGIEAMSEEWAELEMEDRYATAWSNDCSGGTHCRHEWSLLVTGAIDDRTRQHAAASNMSALSVAKDALEELSANAKPHK